MDFSFTSEQIELRDAVRGFFDGTHGPEILRGLEEKGGRDPALWQSLVEMGLTGTLVPEAQGGLELGLIEAALIAAECGYANISEPLVDTALVAPYLIADPDQLSAIAAGMLKVALIHERNPWVADSDQANIILGGQASMTRLESVDPLRRLYAVTHAQSDDVMLDLAALLSAAQLIGAAERMQRLASDYALQREQFGQAIGGFQAIKHLLANISVALEFARPLLWRAAYAAQHKHERSSVHISHAKVAASDAAILASEVAIQVHGAMGYTYEVDLHYWMKRSWALIGAWGDRAWHLRRMEDAVIGGAMDIGPDHIFDRNLEFGVNHNG